MFSCLATILLDLRVIIYEMGLVGKLEYLRCNSWAMGVFFIHR